MTFRSTLLSFLSLAVSTAALAHDGDDPVKHDRSPHNLGDVLIFSGTGWYRHPETAPINGCLAQLSDELEMQVEHWYKQGGGIVALHVAIVHQTE
mgnify:CR=1 FL=1